MTHQFPPGFSFRKFRNITKAAVRDGLELLGGVEVFVPDITSRSSQKYTIEKCFYGSHDAIRQPASGPSSDLLWSIIQACVELVMYAKRNKRKLSHARLFVFMQ